MTTGLQMLSSRDCKLYLPFREGSGSTAYDYSGQGNNGTITGATYKKLVDGGYALDFNGSSDIVSTSGYAFDFDSDYTISLWLYIGSFVNTWLTIIRSENSSGSAQIQILIKNTGLLKYYLRSSSSFDTPITYSAGTFTTGQWYHLIFGRTSNTKFMYINTSNYVSGTTNRNPINTNIHLGRYLGGSYPLDGQIAYPMIFARALSLPEIKAIYRATYIL